jgi:hypothetical protein
MQNELRDTGMVAKVVDYADRNGQVHGVFLFGVDFGPNCTPDFGV